MTPALPVGCVVTVLGAARTGKTQLAIALAERLSRRSIANALVPDPLQDAPASDVAELAAISARHTRCIAREAEHVVVVADGTALTAAMRGETHLGDASLYEDALAAHRGYAVTLLMALDLPWSGTPAEALLREREDALLRAALARAGAPYAVIHGRGPERLANAWNAINSRAEAAGGAASASSRPESAEPAWFWPCDKCSDPACEHRLFSDLIARRG